MSSAGICRVVYMRSNHRFPLSVMASLHFASPRLPYQTPVWNTKARVAHERHGSRITNRPLLWKGGGKRIRLASSILNVFQTQQTVAVSATQAKHDCGNKNARGTWREAPLSLNFESIMSE